MEEVNLSEPVSLLVKKGEAIVMRSVTFGDLKRALEERFGKSVAEFILFDAGFSCGVRSADRLSKHFNVTGRDLLKKVEAHKKGEGWCELSFEEFNHLRPSGRILAKNSFEAKGYGRSDRPICHFLRGFLSGVVSYVTGVKVVLTEVRCLALGNEWCEFRVFRVYGPFRQPQHALS